MADLTPLGIDGQYKHLDSTSVRPADAKATSVMNMEATVDVKPQELLKLRPFNVAIMGIPATIKPEAQIVLQALLSCFEEKQCIKEGLIEDVVWGFAECGIPPACTMIGLKELHLLGYVKFQGPDNSWVDIESDSINRAWIRYTHKVLDMAYSD